MSSRLTSRKRFAVVSLVAAVVAGVGAMAPAPANAGPPAPSGCSVTPDKCYSFSIVSNPSPPVQGQSAAWTGTLTNLSKGSGGLKLGSANVTLDPGFTDIVATGSSVGTETVAGNVIELRAMNLAPNRSMTFSFTAKTPFEPGPCMFKVEAKQSNDFNGTGNNLTNVGGPGCNNVTVASTCTTLPSYDSCGATLVDPSAGGSTQSGTSTSGGGSASIRALIAYAAIDVPPGSPFLSQIHTVLGGDLCPLTGCAWMVSVDNTFPSVYTIERNAITLTIQGASTSDLTIWQYNDSTDQLYLLPPCTPLSTVVPNPVNGSYACLDGNVVRNLTPADDYKVMGMTVGG